MFSLKNIFTYVLYTCLFTSCGHYPKEVESALLSAGKNKENLTEVLDYYRNRDRQKYAAACFLIANMPYHRSKSSLSIPAAYMEYFKKTDSINRTVPNANSNDSIRQILADKYSTLPLPEQKPGKEDIEILTKDFLIHTIDAAFEEWHKSPLLKDLSFDEFKEWILPYRTTDEALINDKSSLRQMMYDKLSRNGMNDIHKPIDLYKKHVRQQRDINKRIIASAHIGIYDLFIPAFKMDCHNQATITCNIFRACGIPVVYEFTPQWPDKDSRHYWCSSPDSTHTFHPYTPPYNNLGEDWELSLKYSGKVYRKTFGAQRNTPYFLKAEEEEIPDIFSQLTLIDVTPNYHVCTNISLPAPPASENKLAYLSFFNTQGLNPVAWGHIDPKKQVVDYEKVPINMLFFPTYMSEEGELTEFNTPFILQQDSITGKINKKDISCNHQNKIKLHLLRKYPHKPHLVNYRTKVKGALLLASHVSEGPYDTLFILPETPPPYWQRYEINNEKKYRYYKLQSKDMSPIYIAEYEFLAKKQGLHTYSTPSQLPIFDSLYNSSPSICPYVKVTGTPMKSGPLRLQACDGNPDTFIESSWFGMEFTTPVCIKALQLYPRNARNGIETGNNYLLLYYDQGKWMEHSTARATGNYLDFYSVPSETIYWLRNLDQGKEELPFFFYKGQQVFINQGFH